MPGHPIAVVLLARLVVDLRQQGNGIGKGLLKAALIRCLNAADAIGIRAVLVHAKDAQAAAFYAQFGFVLSPSDAKHLMPLIKTSNMRLGIDSLLKDLSSNSICSF